MKSKLSITAGCLASLWLYSFNIGMTSALCNPQELPCDDGSCVGRTKWCDDLQDCRDRSDENYCDEKGYWFTDSDPNNCKGTHFLCKNGRCVPTVAACDGVPDCKDESDEQNCSDSNNMEESTARYTEEPEAEGTHFDPQPTAEVRPTYDISSRRQDSQPTPEERQSEETRPRYSDQQPAIFSPTDLPTETYPNRPDGHRRFLPPPEIHTEETGYDRQIRGPGPVIRRATAPKRTRPTSESLRLAQEWLLHERNNKFAWGRDTSRAVVALSLSENGRFIYERADTTLMKMKLQVLLAVDLMRNNSTLSLSRMSLYINSLMATCQNPRDFHGRDLADELRKRTNAAKSQITRNGVSINPITYLTLCMVNETSEEDVHSLRDFLFPKAPQQKWLDMQAISIMAYSCIAKIPRFTSTCKPLLENAVKDLIRRKGENGNFGNVYSSALAVQALLSADATSRYDYELSVNFLKSNQRHDGSFGDLLATYYVLPVLAGKSLTHLTQVACNRTITDGLTIESLRNSRAPMHYIRYSLYFGDPVQATNSKTLRVPVNSSFFDIMKLAAEMDLKFRFQEELENGDITIYSISNVPNDAEKGIYWQLYLNSNLQAVNGDGLSVSDLQPYDRGVQHIVPKAEDHMVFWYRPILK